MRTLYNSLIPALWSAWAIYWCAAAITAKPVRRRESIGSRLSHIVPLVVGIGLMVSPRLAGTILAARFLPRTAIWFWLGTALVVAGLGFSVAARVYLGGNWSGTVTLKHDHTLTRTGPYRFVRHPIYTGLLTAMLGSVVALGECRGLLALALFIAAFLRKIRIEEAFLTEQFGPAYLRYRQEVAALIPGVI